VGFFYLYSLILFQQHRANKNDSPSTLPHQHPTDRDHCTHPALLLETYIIFQRRFFHPLARYLSPLIASLTNVLKTYYIYNLNLHEKLVELHLQYGPVVRIGPNDLHFWTPDSIATIYKGGRMVGKTECPYRVST